VRSNAWDVEFLTNRGVCASRWRWSRYDRGPRTGSNDRAASIAAARYGDAFAPWR